MKSKLWKVLNIGAGVCFGAVVTVLFWFVLFALGCPVADGAEITAPASFTLHASNYDSSPQWFAVDVDDGPETNQFNLPPGSTMQVVLPLQESGGISFYLSGSWGSHTIVPGAHVYVTYSYGENWRTFLAPPLPSPAAAIALPFEIEDSELELFLEGFWFSIGIGLLCLIAWYLRLAGSSGVPPV